MELTISSNNQTCTIHILSGNIYRLFALCDVTKRTFILADNHLDPSIIEMVKKQFKNASVFLAENETKKSMIRLLQNVIGKMANLNFTCRDQLLVFGGQRIIHFGAFLASIYQGGMDFITIPTSTLGMTDCYLGEKNDVDIGDFAQVIGTYKTPKMVIMDPDLCKTLSPRYYKTGLAPALRAGIFQDVQLYDMFLMDRITPEDLPIICYRSLFVKKNFIESGELFRKEPCAWEIGYPFNEIGESYVFDRNPLLKGETILSALLLLLQKKFLYKDLLKVSKKLGVTIDLYKRVPDYYVKNCLNRMLNQEQKIDYFDIDVVGTFEKKKGTIQEFMDLLPKGKQ